MLPKQDAAAALPRGGLVYKGNNPQISKCYLETWLGFVILVREAWEKGWKMEKRSRRKGECAGGGA